MRTYPENDNIKESKNVSTLIFGNRFKGEQTLYEYLIEFLLIFTSAKNEDLTKGKMTLHNIEEDGNISYWVEPRMALRRFIAFDKTKKKGAIKEDAEAYNELFEALKEKFSNSNETEAEENVESIQDMFHGYAVVIKNRFWGAQALLPICPEFLFCGANPNDKERKKKVDYYNDPASIDKFFAFDKRNFIARGGELYYLHVLQGLVGQDEKRAELEKLLTELMTVQCNKISKLASFVQTTWEEKKNIDHKELIKKFSLAYIPATGYEICGKNTVDELINFLSANLHPINRIELLAKGVMLQIMRMMSMRVADYLDIKPFTWIVDMNAGSNGTVKKIAANSFNNIENGFMDALTRQATELGLSDSDLHKACQTAKNDSFDIFKSKGKELKFIIPISGSFERFSLPEDIIRFLVLSLIKPGDKMTIDMFLEKLYKHYNIVIGPKEYKLSLKDDSNLDVNLANSFIENANAFQSFLNNTGFLKELSDATSVVINPYES